MAAEAVIGGNGCSLWLRLDAYERAETDDDWYDSNWLRGQATLTADAMGRDQLRRHGISLLTSEIREFCDQLRRLVEQGSGEAHLEPMEPEIGCRVQLRDGLGTITAFLHQPHPNVTVSVEGETDTSRLLSAIDGLDTVTRAFPERGTRT